MRGFPQRPWAILPTRRRRLTRKEGASARKRVIIDAAACPEATRPDNQSHRTQKEKLLCWGTRVGKPKSVRPRYQ